MMKFKEIFLIEKKNNVLYPSTKEKGKPYISQEKCSYMKLSYRQKPSFPLLVDFEECRNSFLNRNAGITYDVKLDDLSSFYIVAPGMPFFKYVARDFFWTKETSNIRNVLIGY